MKTTVYRYSSQNTMQVVGCYPTYGLDEYEPSHRLFNPQSRVCTFETNKDHGFWAWPDANDGYTPTVLDDWWSVQTFAYDIDGNCYGRYNPTVKREGTRAVVDFSWKLSATEGNLEKILREIERRAFGDDKNNE